MIKLVIIFFILSRYDVIVPTNTTMSGFTNSTKSMEHSSEVGLTKYLS